MSVNVVRLKLSKQAIGSSLTRIGIPEVEYLAREAQFLIITTDVHNDSEYARSPSFRLLKDGEKVELMTRAFVREQFGETMKGVVEGPEAVPLRDVLFNFAYPTPPLEWFKAARSL